MKSFEELKQQDQVDAEEALKLSMEEHLKATGNVHNLKASEIGSTLPQWNANKILGNPVRFVSDKDGNTLQYNEKEQSFDLKPAPKLEFLGEGDIKVSKVGEKVVIKSDVSKSDTVVGLKHAISTKAPSVHEHKDYVLKGDLNSKLLKLSEDKSSKNHSHNNYVTFPVIEKLKGELDKSLEIGLSKKAERNHKHDLKIPTFKKEFGKIEKDINTLQEVVGVVGDKSNLVTKADLKIAVSEVVSLPVKKHEHTDYAKVIEIDKLKKTITELKIVDKKGNNKAIENLLAYKAERNHAHSVGEIQGLSSTLSALGSTYLKIDGSNYMTTKLGIGTAPRAGSVIDIISSGTGSVGNVASGSITFNYGSGGYYNEGLSFQFDVYAYRTFGATTVYSATPYSITGTDNNNWDSPYNFTLNWGMVTGADGYRLVVMNDPYYGATGNYYFDFEGTSVIVGYGDIAYVSELSSYYTGPTTPTVTPTTTTAGADFYLDTMGDLHSTGDFYFGNYPSLSLGNNNGLVLTGTHAKQISLSTTSIVKLGGLSLAQSYTAGANQLIFPQGAGGSSAPGIRFVGGQTVGGLAMNDGVFEFWNNFGQYVDSPAAGHLQAVFRIDTRSGYEVEGFTVGGSSPSGVGAAAIGVDFNYFDVNLCYYGHGSVAIGSDTNTLGVRGTDGYLAVKKSIYVGENLFVNSAGGMKIATTTSQKIGFYGTTPIAQPSAYTVTNPSSDRSFDVSNTSVNELAVVLGTLIGDLKSLGLIG